MSKKISLSDEEKSSQFVLLFYKFHPLSKEHETVELYRSALENLCQDLNLQGRILVGCNEHQSEGINGTLSGNEDATIAFVYALTKNEDKAKTVSNPKAISTFWEACQVFYQQANCGSLFMDPSEFKWSTCTKSQLFPDLNIKIVKELIGTGGVLAPISLEEVHQGYLTPSEWHDRIAEMKEGGSDDTILIDCRNTKEWQIGHFPGAHDPSTTTFNQFPTWVQQHSQTLANKKVLMYCTGGIRCEKASAFIRRTIPTVQEVRHLKGGIHKYLDEYGDKEECMWQGKNFVFDGRGMHAAGGRSNKSGGGEECGIVGACLYCQTPHDMFEPGCVCTVCREPTLVCPRCREKLREFHCQTHAHLRRCYFTDLASFSLWELQQQHQELNTIIQDIAIGRKFKQKRKTLTKQCHKIEGRIAALEAGEPTFSVEQHSELKCRNCGEAGCSGKCWGFHGLKRKRILAGENQPHPMTESESQPNASGSKNRRGSDGRKCANNVHLQEKKALERQMAIDELIHLQLSAPPSSCYDSKTGIRVPKSCTRVLRTNTKGKWCGKALLPVLQEEFAELSESEGLSQILQRGLLFVNDTRVMSLVDAESMELKNMDVISRVVHWHEPPVHIPSEKIGVQQVRLPITVMQEYELGDDATIYVCNKPSSVPVHPAGPYLSNSMTIMVEAQEGLMPKSLIPCHRIDRVTSGLTICCSDVKVARLIQSRINEGFVRKQYLAKVHGRFPCTWSKTKNHMPVSTDIAKWSWSTEEENIQIDAPIETVDPSNGIRKITDKGKSARSVFQYIAYDEADNTSMIACTPVTGRSHQLRVHLQWLGFPIVDDIQYGGEIGPSVNLSAGLQAMERTEVGYSDEVDLRLPFISDTDVNAGREICPCCTQGPVVAFSSSQLLQGGHQICLHAYRYVISICPKRRGKGTTHHTDAASLAVVDLKVGIPDWAFATDGLDVLTLPKVKK